MQWDRNLRPDGSPNPILYALPLCLAYLAPKSQSHLVFIHASPNVTPQQKVHATNLFDESENGFAI